MKMTKTYGYLIAAAMIAVPAVSEARTIDDFTEGAFFLTAPTEDFAISGSGILGGEREVTVFEVGGDSFDPPNPDINAGFATGDNALSLNSGTTDQGRFVLEYGSDFNLDADLTAGGADAIVVDFASVSGTGSLQLIATGDDEGVTSRAVTSPGLVVFEFSDPEFTSSSIVDFTDIERLNFNLDALDPGADFVISSISTREAGTTPTPTAIPTPAALPAGLVLMGGLLTRRRRQA